MKELIFATHNINKVVEIRSLLPAHLSIKSLVDCGITQAIPEPFDTIAENALEKARVVSRMVKTNCFSEDTGLEVAALDGSPGVRSARYAGEQASDAENRTLLLKNMINNNRRDAQFKTVIALIFNDKEYLFEGICEGVLTENEIGQNGFGYDSLFVPHGTHKTFAEMELTEKNMYSHRKKAFAKLLAFLNANHG